MRRVMRTKVRIKGTVPFILIGLLMSAPVYAVEPGPVAVRVESVVSDAGLDRPAFATPMPGGEGGLVVAQQRGRVMLSEPGDAAGGVELRVLLDLTAVLPNYADRGRDQLGLLGLAFHPDFAEKRTVYLHYTAARPRRNVVSVWTVMEDGVIDAGSERVLLEQRQTYATNNGGGLAFGPDGYLYIGIGDGGANGDPHNNAQDLTTLLGKVLRINVDGEAAAGLSYGIPADNPFVDLQGGAGEVSVEAAVYAYGLSNPWRFSFDRETGELWLGDVGENSWEEINRIEKGGNYGWRWREGTHVFREAADGEVLPIGLIDPVYAYPHTAGKAVVGGYVYRGKAIPELVGQYIYADYVSGKVWAMKLDERGAVTANTHLLTVPHPASLGEDADGELLICSFGPDPKRPGDDGVYRLVPE